MADSQRLALSVYLARDRIDLRITQFSWPSKFSIPVHDFRASICLDNRVFVGRGVDTNHNESLNKALGEAFERSAFSNAQSTISAASGAAVHVTEALAYQNAVLELLERDSFFCHFLTQTPMARIEDLHFTDLDREVKRWAETFGIELKFREMCMPPGYFGASLIANGSSAARPFGARVGLGASCISLRDAVRKALLEIIPILAFAIESADRNLLTVEGFANAAKISGDEHRSWGMNPESFESIKALLGEVLYAPQPLNVSFITTKVIARPSFWPSQVSLVAVEATHPRAQNTFSGAPSVDTINFARLSEFARRKIELKDLPPLPHPIG